MVKFVARRKQLRLFPRPDRGTPDISRNINFMARDQRRTHSQNALTTTYVVTMPAKVSSCLFFWICFAALSSHLWHVTVGTPVWLHDKDECVRLSRTLLLNVARALTEEKLYEGFNCTEENMVIKRTVSACEPNEGQNQGCSGTHHAKFNENECLENIKVDLEQYRNELLAYQRDELNSVVESIQDLLKNCNFPSALRDASALTTPRDPQHSERSFNFDTRLKLCRELKGFHVRTITINRIMGYMAA
ncbi:hypothetical protein GJAV_G00053390 [Gymnothorax javanicus]|nr:hypothetical protein GJAV_G00053390 [Gymnothorax javanicus]